MRCVSQKLEAPVRPESSPLNGEGTSLCLESCSAVHMFCLYPVLTHSKSWYRVCNCVYFSSAAPFHVSDPCSVPKCCCVYAMGSKVIHSWCEADQVLLYVSAVGPKVADRQSEADQLLCVYAVGPKVADRQSEADQLLKSDAANPDRALFNSDVRINFMVV